MRAVITVLGKDTVGILASVSAACATHRVNILEVTQSVLQDFFAMMMLVDIANADIPLDSFADELNALGQQQQLSVHVMHEDIFTSMHEI